MDDSEFRKALQRAAKAQGLDPEEVLSGWEAGQALPQPLAELMARVLREMAGPDPDQGQDQSG